MHLGLGKRISIFAENEVVVGLMTGKIKYKGFSKKEKYTEPVFCYNAGLGIEYDLKGFDHRLYEAVICAAIGYSTLNYRDKIIQHQPIGYKDDIPYQNASIFFYLQLKIPLIMHK